MSDIGGGAPSSPRLGRGLMTGAITNGVRLTIIFGDVGVEEDFSVSRVGVDESPDTINEVRVLFHWKTPLWTCGIGSQLSFLLPKTNLLCVFATPFFSTQLVSSSTCFHLLYCFNHLLIYPLLRRSPLLNHHHSEVVVCSCHTSHVAFSTCGEIVPHFSKQCPTHSPIAKKGYT